MLYIITNFVQLLSQDGATPLSMASMSVGISNRLYIMFCPFLGGSVMRGSTVIAQ